MSFSFIINDNLKNVNPEENMSLLQGSNDPNPDFK